MKPQNRITITRFATPIGEMIAGATDEGLLLFDFSKRRMIDSVLNRIRIFQKAELIDGYHPHFNALKEQFKAYLAGERMEFQLPLLFSGTPFQIRVWNELTNIPYGRTRSYKQQAMALGDVKAIRAVARANGENCFAVLVPCHRVIAENGDLTGYAGGLAKKKWLLNFERKNSAKELQGSLF
ncbi:MAG: methylated-DNA--[protein]-cysteine S-methyltransferase [Bacteroidetes bacterium]|nr:methylated-DNA--[protein]-cysteine S-methyltransferase [Bacteroidota bacterium]HET6243098.1 methylated-DNA--[protein]-cysteine S-methyltransferase [Bacteroidia bacterium]